MVPIHYRLMAFDKYKLLGGTFWLLRNEEGSQRQQLDHILSYFSVRSPRSSTLRI